MTIRTQAKASGIAAGHRGRGLGVVCSPISEPGRLTGRPSDFGYLRMKRDRQLAGSGAMAARQSHSSNQPWLPASETPTGDGGVIRE